MTTVFIVGLGTIGQPLARALLKLRQEFGIDELIVHKNTPKIEDRGMIRRFQKRGAKLCVYENQRDGFEQIELKADYNFSEAIDVSTAVIDCTKDNMALKLKEDYYLSHRLSCCRGFIAQGGAKEFGKPFAYDINNKILKPVDKFIQVVSCNTHNILAILHTIVLMYEGPNNLLDAHFDLQRRVSDISQDEAILGIEVGTPSDLIYGSHQAADATKVLKTIGINDINIHSVANKSPNAFMHVIGFNLQLKNPITKDEVVNRFRKNLLTGVTYQRTNNKVFSAGRDWGHFGRILNQTVICLPSIGVKKSINNDYWNVYGTCFTPQDGNSLLSSFAALSFLLDKTKQKTEWQKTMKKLFYSDPFIFDDEV